MTNTIILLENLEDITKLDELTIQITTNWYKNKDISKFLECHEIN